MPTDNDFMLGDDNNEMMYDFLTGVGEVPIEEADHSENPDNQQLYLENLYYQSKNIQDANVDDAIKGYNAILNTNEEASRPTIWHIKALKRLIKIYFETKNYSKVLLHLEQLINIYTQLLPAELMVKAKLEKIVVSLVEYFAQSVDNSEEDDVDGNTDDNMDGNMDGNRDGNVNNNVDGKDDINTSNGPSNGPEDGREGIKMQKRSLVQALQLIEASALEKNTRIWYRIKTLMARIALRQKDYRQAGNCIRSLYARLDGRSTANSSTLHSGDAIGIPREDYQRPTQLLEVLSIEMQMLTNTNSIRALRTAYNRAFSLKTILPHPKIIATIRECGGRMHFNDGAWTESYRDYFEAFRSYDEVGGMTEERIRCLKYLMICAMLASGSNEEHQYNHADGDTNNIDGNDTDNGENNKNNCDSDDLKKKNSKAFGTNGPNAINPLESPEARPFRDEPEIKILDLLLDAFVSGKIEQFDQILKGKDGFLGEYLEILSEDLRLSGLEKIVNGINMDTNSIEIAQLAQMIVSNLVNTERLLSRLIMDGKIKGRLDLVNHLFVKTDRMMEKKLYFYRSLLNWISAIETEQCRNKII